MIINYFLASEEPDFVLTENDFATAFHDFNQVYPKEPKSPLRREPKSPKEPKSPRSPKKESKVPKKNEQKRTSSERELGVKTNEMEEMDQKEIQEIEKMFEMMEIETEKRNSKGSEQSVTDEDNKGIEDSPNLQSSQKSKKNKKKSQKNRKRKSNNPSQEKVNNEEGVVVAVTSTSHQEPNERDSQEQGDQNEETNPKLKRKPTITIPTSDPISDQTTPKTLEQFKPQVESSPGHMSGETSTDLSIDHFFSASNPQNLLKLQISKHRKSSSKSSSPPFSPKSPFHSPLFTPLTSPKPGPFRRSFSKSQGLDFKSQLTKSLQNHTKTRPKLQADTFQNGNTSDSDDEATEDAKETDESISSNSPRIRRDLVIQTSKRKKKRSIDSSINSPVQSFLARKSTLKKQNGQ